MLGWSINLFRIRGIQLSLHFTFLLFLAYGAYDGYRDGGVGGMAWETALLLAFFTCVVLHELGHSFAARRFGIGVRRILLMPIGGMAEFDSIPREPARELVITFAGPAVNFLIAGLLWLAVRPPDFASGLAVSPASPYEFGCTLYSINLLMGVFNFTPAFPMDGGRILRALLAMWLPYVRATFWAASIGKVVCVGCIAIAIYLHNPLTAILFLFIFAVGELEYRGLRRRERDEAQWRAMMDQYHAPPPLFPPNDPPLL